MGSQSTAKTIFLLVSMLGWLIIGGALIYAGPMFYHLWAHSETSTLWITNLNQGGYEPFAALRVAGILLVLEIISYWLWYSRFNTSATRLSK
jgi:hypothetical protein